MKVFQAVSIFFDYQRLNVKKIQSEIMRLSSTGLKINSEVWS